MTPEEAISLLDNLIGMVEDNHDSDYDGALKVAINALEKQVPQKPVNDEINDIPRLCPRCGSWELENDISECFEYCPHCGQAIKEDE